MQTKLTVFNKLTPICDILCRYSYNGTKNVCLMYKKSRSQGAKGDDKSNESFLSKA
jgi:hypothetical protein